MYNLIVNLFSVIFFLKIRWSKTCSGFNWLWISVSAWDTPPVTGTSTYIVSITKIPFSICYWQWNVRKLLLFCLDISRAMSSYPLILVFIDLIFIQCTNIYISNSNHWTRRFPAQRITIALNQNPLFHSKRFLRCGSCVELVFLNRFMSSSSIYENLGLFYVSSFPLQLTQFFFS